MQRKILQTSFFSQELLGRLSFPGVLGFVVFSFCRGSVHPFFLVLFLFFCFFLVNDCYQETCADSTSLSILLWGMGILAQASVHLYLADLWSWKGPADPVTGISQSSVWRCTENANCNNWKMWEFKLCFVESYVSPWYVLALAHIYIYIYRNIQVLTNFQPFIPRIKCSRVVVQVGKTIV